jgi:predicted lipoprotein with Yx(FWY)xxD motif
MTASPGAAVFVALMLTSSLVAAQSARTLSTGDIPGIGEYLSDDSGMAIYMFEEDRREGFRGRSVESDCLDECLARWPPLSGDPLPVAGEGVDPALIGSFIRPDGRTQATYGGWPLYYFAEDFLPGDIHGHAFEEFGGEWYLLTPEGLVIGGDDENDQRDD